ncbi:unnamed protein product [Rodentolepis nana]|uniref:Uncharacterized protein n=1 Tax=Rodentolepis nana TaxID=102285 RepID=A0A0R3T9F0_RODNA|nr:unnamed protein product [Rodentolepis nana]
MKSSTVSASRRSTSAWSWLRASVTSAPAAEILIV